MQMEGARSQRRLPAGALNVTYATFLSAEVIHPPQLQEKDLLLTGKQKPCPSAPMLILLLPLQNPG